MSMLCVLCFIAVYTHFHYFDGSSYEGRFSGIHLHITYRTYNLLLLPLCVLFTTKFTAMSTILMIKWVEVMFRHCCLNNRSSSLSILLRRVIVSSRYNILGIIIVGKLFHLGFCPFLYKIQIYNIRLAVTCFLLIQNQTEN